MTDLKKQLYSLCMQFVEQRILHAQLAINNARESANDEGKSSAGDKHETGRAMAQLEQEKAAFHLQEAIGLKKVLERINIEINSPTAQVGSIIETNKGNFFISIPAGKLQVGTQSFYAISIQSPIGMKFKGLSVNDKFEFNGQFYEIKNVL